MNFDSKQVIKIIEDAFNYKYEDYITSGFRKNYCFIKTLRKYNVNKYNEYIKEVLSTDNEMANMAVLAFYKYYKKIHKEELKFNEIIFLIMKKDISFEQLSYFPTIEIEDYNKVQAKQIFDLVLNFAGYGFNRSHSVAYSIVSYQMAYFKANYFTVFMANILNQSFFCVLFTRTSAAVSR